VKQGHTAQADKGSRHGHGVEVARIARASKAFNQRAGQVKQQRKWNKLEVNLSRIRIKPSQHAHPQQ
jgi:hypothetical protein